MFYDHEAARTKLHIRLEALLPSRNCPLITQLSGGLIPRAIAGGGASM